MTFEHSTPLVVVTGGLPLGGSTTFLLNLGRAFRQRGLELPIFFLSGSNEMARDFTSAGVEVMGPADAKLIYEDRLRETYLRVAALKPAAVLANLGADSFEILRTLPKNVARLGIVHSDEPGPYEVIRDFAPWLDAVVGVSQTICSKLSREPFAGKLRVEHISYGIHFGPGRTVQLRAAAQPLRLIYIGRIIEEQKRVSRLVQLAKTLQARGEKFEFTLVGSGPSLQSCRESLADLPNVRFLGDVPNEKIREHLRASDVFVLLSDYEGLPLSLLEAMGEGVVPVVSDIESGIRQLVASETGVRVPMGDVGAAADEIISLARDAAKLATLANNGAAFVRREFSAQATAERYCNLIGELAKSEATWPSNISVPVPLDYGNRWLLQSWSRPIRRVIKRASGA